MAVHHLFADMKVELERILDFWLTKCIDKKKGGFIGRMDHEGNIHEDAVKGVVLNARILWTFSSAYREDKKEEYRETAIRAYEYLKLYFLDNKSGGYYWSVSAEGIPLEDRKQIYGQAFVLYGMCAYYKLTGKKEVLDDCLDIFNLIERYSFDEKKNGYIEAFSKDWNPIEDLRLSAKDDNEAKTMNTHLHILEAYTALYQVSGDEIVLRQLSNLVDLFIERFYDKSTGHNHLFFDDNWNSRSVLISFGHDIEASWLIWEAAEVIGKDSEDIKQICLTMARASLSGVDKDGGMWYESDPSIPLFNKEKHWWPQAEAIVGFYNAYRLSGDHEFLDKSSEAWKYTRSRLIDEKFGEWIWGRDENGQPMKEDLAGFWKCPYHNGRAMMLMTRWTRGI
jgi:cellobiose epimerase